MLKRTLIAAAISLATLSAAAPAFAQQNGLVNVTITHVDILNNFLNDAQLAALNNIAVPITVAVPISVAANVCGLSIAVLLAQAVSPAECTATTGSQRLAQQVITRQRLHQLD